MSVAPSFSVIPAHHSYSVGMVSLCMLLHLSARVGLRCVEAVLQVLNVFFPLPQAIPSWSSSRLWLLRVGYYKLTRKKVLATDWVWIVDLTIQAGDLKCLAIVGLRLSDWEQQRKQSPDPTLRHQDVEPIELVPVRQSNGDLVYQQLEEAVYKTGVPRQIIADEGSDVKAGIEKFIQRHRQTDYIYDVKHFTARLLEGEFKSDLMWVEFTKWASETRSKLHQTDLSYLEPPNQRSKSRYMNMEILVDWGLKGLAFLDSLETSVRPESEIQVIQQKLDWLVQFREDLLEWQETMDLVEKTETFVRKEGFFRGCDQELRSLLRLSPKATERIFRIRWSLIEYVLDTSLKAGPEERLLGSSEVLESVFGKFKYMQHEHDKGSLTGMVLAIPAMISKTTQDVIQRAMETVPVQDVRIWMKKMFGQSARVRRKEAFSAPDIPEQKPDQFLLTA